MFINSFRRVHRLRANDLGWLQFVRHAHTVRNVYTSKHSLAIVSSAASNMKNHSSKCNSSSSTNKSRRSIPNLGGLLTDCKL